MDWKFYDVKAKKAVKAEVTGKKVYGEGKRARYAFKAQTSHRLLQTRVRAREYLRYRQDRRPQD